MTVSTSSPIRRAIVKRLRAPGGPRSYVFPANDRLGRGGQVLSGKWLHEGFAPEKIDYPFVTHQQWPTTPNVDTWGSRMLLARFDIKAWSPSSVEADNLDALIATVLDGHTLSVAGQSTLICHRVSDLRSPDVDEEGTKIYQVGGTYEVWTDQPRP